MANILSDLLMLVPKITAAAGRGAGVLSTYNSKDPNSGKTFDSQVSKGFNDPMAALGPYQEGVKKALKSAGEDHTTEALAAGVPADHIEKQAGFRGHSASGQWEEPPTPPQPPAQNQPEQMAPAQQDPHETLGIINRLAQFLYQPGGTNQNGAYQSPSMMGGFIRQAPEDILRMQQAYNLTPGAQIGLEKRRAQEVPLTQSESANIGLKEKELQSTMFKNQVDSLNEELQRINGDQSVINEQIKAYTPLRGPKNAMSGGPSREQKALQNQMTELENYKNSVYGKLSKLRGSYGQKESVRPSKSASSAAIAEAKRRGLI